MQLSLGGLPIVLGSDSAPVREGWAALFAGQTGQVTEEADGPRLTLELKLEAELPPLPAGAPIFIDGRGIVDVYTPATDAFVLHFRDGALLTISPAANRVDGIVTPPALEEGRLEDITYTGLAPLLRRRGRYLVHAFAASQKGRALLLIGPSGSGKTTTGLSLILAGWHLLANDVVLLRRRSQGIHAYPTPGEVSVRPPSLTLLPALRQRRGQHDPRLDIYRYTGSALTGSSERPAAAPVVALCFPTVTGAAESRLSRQPAAVTLAQLMEQSVDRWDRHALSGHLALLQALSAQAAGYQLHLGRAVTALPSLLAGLLQGGARS